LFGGEWNKKFLLYNNNIFKNKNKNINIDDNKHFNKNTKNSKL